MARKEIVHDSIQTKYFFKAIEEISKEKGVPAELICSKIGNSLVKAAAHALGIKEGVYCDIDMPGQNGSKDGKIELYVLKEVIPEPSDEPEEETFEEVIAEENGEIPEDEEGLADLSEFDEEIEEEEIHERRYINPNTVIYPEEAQKYMKGAKVGDFVRFPLEINNFGRIAAQSVKHILRQGIHEAECELVLKQLQGEVQDIITGTVVFIDPKTENVTLKIKNSDVTLPKNEQIPGEEFKIDQTVSVYLVDVKESEKGPRAIISRTHPGLVKRLFEKEVTELQEGLIEIKGISREAGSRTKISVCSKDEDVDPVGSCIGPKGSRVNAVVASLNGEKIDVISYSDDITQYVAAALAPASICSVEILSDAPNSCRVTVPDDQLSLAIGNKGQNARLAAKLTGWKIDIKPLSGFYQPAIKI